MIRSSTGDIIHQYLYTSKKEGGGGGDEEAIFRSGYEHTVSRSCAMNVGDDSRNMLEHVSLSAATALSFPRALRRSCYRVATVVIKRALLPYNYEYSWVLQGEGRRGSP